MEETTKEIRLPMKGEHLIIMGIVYEVKFVDRKNGEVRMRALGIPQPDATPVTRREDNE